MKLYSLGRPAFFERVVFNFLIGNGDAHFKNYSICYLDDRQIRLTPVYDLVCTKLIIPEERDSALMINGADDRLIKKMIQSSAFALTASLLSLLLQEDRMKIKLHYERYPAES